MFGKVTFKPAGPVRRLPSGAMQFPYGGSVECEGRERRITANDELSMEFGPGTATRVLINGVPLEQIGLDS